MCYTGLTMSAQRTHHDQLEFVFAPKLTARYEVKQLDSGHVLIGKKITIEEEEEYIPSRVAAEELGKSQRWVQEALAAGRLKGRRIGRNWEALREHVEEMKEDAKNW